MTSVFVLNKLRWPLRIPIKWALFALTVLAVCFPYPNRLIRHVRHWRDPSALIEPDAPSLGPLIAELRSELAADLSPQEVLKAVERYVYRRIPYDWDWNTWGTADYLPTVAEAIEKGREDCDGRAVVAASLLQHLGFKAEIVTDFAHIWVRTEAGETMGPGRGKAVIATEDGLRIQRGALAQLPRALAYGIAPFPLGRELIIIGVMWLLLLRPKGGMSCGAAALALFVGGVLLLREGGEDYSRPVVWLQALGATTMIAGFVCLLVWAGRNAQAAPSSSP